MALSETNESLARLDENRSLLLRETAHGVANNFATVAALLSMRSTSVDDVKAKRSLDEAVEQVKVMATGV
jgi:two-component sensor histidine kinase